MRYSDHAISPKRLGQFLILFGVMATSFCRADVIFNSDFSKDSLDTLGWRTKDTPWQEYDYGATKANLANNPGMTVRFPATKDGQGTLTRKFPVVDSPKTLTLTFDAGWGWGAANMGSDAFDVMILDDNGNGYIFSCHRTNATWAAQWGKVTAYAPQTPQLNWAPAAIDASQAAVIDGGGLQTFTISRDENGAWLFSGAKWSGATPLAFSDSTTTSFTQVVLVGKPNTDDIVFNKIKLETTSP